MIKPASRRDTFVHLTYLIFQISYSIGYAEIIYPQIFFMNNSRYIIIICRCKLLTCTMYSLLFSLFYMMYLQEELQRFRQVCDLYIVTVVLCKHEHEMYIKVNVHVYTASLVSRLPPVQYIVE